MTLHSYFKKVFVFIFLASLASAHAQKLEIGVGGGVMNYKGDVAPGGFYPQFSRPGGSLFVRHNTSQAVSFKFSVAYGSIFADDAQSYDEYAKRRNWQFTANITEVAAAFEYNFLNFRDPSSRKLGSPYLHIGLAGFRFTEKGNTNPSYSTTQLAIPFGVGYRRILTGNLNLGLEIGARKTFTDYLDNYGGDLVDSRFANGNPYNKDMYFFTQIMVSYTFYSVKCPR